MSTDLTPPRFLGTPNATPHRGQIKSRDRVRELAEVYTHKREVDAMLDLVPEMFPTDDDPSNTDRKFLEPACGSGNFLEEILLRKLRFVSVKRYGAGGRYEHRILRALASIYAIDISQDNVDESRERLHAVIIAHVDNDMNTKNPTSGFMDAVETILATNILCGDTLVDAGSIRLIDYQAGRNGTFTREWSYLDPGKNEDLFALLEVGRDENPVHYSELRLNPWPVVAGARNIYKGA
ncbi:type III restriction endonuclease subunit M [Rathayibacter festucae]|uniref:Type III restriction endonuclease subunit M n=1 Tax=Rathayibacter festucae TaxID=110937 RepID=A0ABX6H3Y4_9MICO|nr:type III restriction endonuclease subunit M [Rathayibacter festucae]QHC64504.1 type III restriction endonuclease subunit M [Rathayibacter festucae]